MPSYMLMERKPEETKAPSWVRPRQGGLLLTCNQPPHTLILMLQGNIFIKLTVFSKHQKHRISQTDTGRKNHSSIQKQHTEGTLESKCMQKSHQRAAGRHTELPHTWQQESVQHGSNCLPTKDTKNQVKDEKWAKDDQTNKIHPWPFPSYRIIYL